MPTALLKTFHHPIQLLICNKVIDIIIIIISLMQEFTKHNFELLNIPLHCQHIARLHCKIMS